MKRGAIALIIISVLIVLLLFFLIKPLGSKACLNDIDCKGASGDFHGCYSDFPLIGGFSSVMIAPPLSCICYEGNCEETLELVDKIPSKNALDICMDLEEGPIKEQCIWGLAIDNKDYTYCDNFNNLTYVHECYYMVAYNTKDESVCYLIDYNITSQYWKTKKYSLDLCIKASNS